MLSNGEYNFELSQHDMNQRMKTMWIHKNGLCGPGSSLDATKEIRFWLPHIINYFNIQSINDAGCGNQSWINTILLNIDYQGYDLIDNNSKNIVLDITTSLMRSCDLIICRDVLFHLTIDRINSAIKLFQQSGKYLLTTFYDKKFKGNESICAKNKFAKLCLLDSPFNFPLPILQFYESNQNRYMGLWKLSDINR